MWPDPPDPIKVATEPIPMVPVAIIGTGDGGLTNTIATTPGQQPNLAVTIITPLMAILVRFGNQFLTTLVGLVGAGMTPAGGDLLQAKDFMDLVFKCATLSVAGAGFGLLKDCVTIFGRLEGKYPLLTGGV